MYDMRDELIAELRTQIVWLTEQVRSLQLTNTRLRNTPAIQTALTKNDIRRIVKNAIRDDRDSYAGGDWGF